jgi:hypothetical protein
MIDIGFLISAAALALFAAICGGAFTAALQILLSDWRRRGEDGTDRPLWQAGFTLFPGLVGLLIGLTLQIEPPDLPPAGSAGDLPVWAWTVAGGLQASLLVKVLRGHLVRLLWRWGDAGHLPPGGGMGA